MRRMSTTVRGVRCSTSVMSLHHAPWKKILLTLGVVYLIYWLDFGRKLRTFLVNGGLGEPEFGMWANTMQSYTRADNGGGEYDPDSLNEIYRMRNQVVDIVCNQEEVKKAQISLATVLKNVIVSDQGPGGGSSFSFCFVPKIASSFLLSMAQNLSGIDPTLDHSGVAQELGLNPTKHTAADMELLKEGGFRFVVVRHPLVRLVSAFLDKTRVDDRPTAQDFQNGIRTSFGRDPDSQIRFDDFVKDVMSKKHLKAFYNHFKPIHWICNFCNAEYDAIVKQEEWDQDMKYVVTKAKIPIPLSSLSKKINNSTSSSTETASNDEYVTKLYRSLEPEDLQELKDYYKLDFDMFLYNPDKYD